MPVFGARLSQPSADANYRGTNCGRSSEINKTIKRKNFIVMAIFKEEVEIDAPTQVGLVVTGPVTGVGAGAQSATTGPRSREV